jgi:hypothetical protein
MADNDDHHIRRLSTQKCNFKKFCFLISIHYFYKFFLARLETMSSLPQPRISVSSPNSPINKGNTSDNPSRSRQLWNRAVESVLEHEKTTPTSISMSSSTAINEPIGWYNLTRR